MPNQPNPVQTKQSASVTPIIAQARGSDLQPTQDAFEYLKAYARERPEVAALWCFGIGFILGWKLKPW